MDQGTAALLGGALTGVLTVIGVGITQVGTNIRQRATRLEEARREAYLALMQLYHRVLHEAPSYAHRMRMSMIESIGNPQMAGGQFSPSYVQPFNLFEITDAESKVLLVADKGVAAAARDLSKAMTAFAALAMSEGTGMKLEGIDTNKKIDVCFDKYVKEVRRHLGY